MIKRAIIIFAISACVVFAFSVGAAVIHLSQDNRTLVTRVARDEATLKANIAAQVPNRVANVHLWCGFIAQDRDYARARAKARIKLDPTVKPYTLTDPNCNAIADRTANSAKHTAKH